MLLWDDLICAYDVRPWAWSFMVVRNVYMWIHHEYHQSTCIHSLYVFMNIINPHAYIQFASQHPATYNLLYCNTLQYIVHEYDQYTCIFSWCTLHARKHVNIEVRCMYVSARSYSQTDICAYICWNVSCIHTEIFDVFVSIHRPYVFIYIRKFGICCSVLQCNRRCVAGCCSVLQGVVVCCRVL